MIINGKRDSYCQEDREANRGRSTVSDLGEKHYFLFLNIYQDKWATMMVNFEYFTVNKINSAQISQLYVIDFIISNIGIWFYNYQISFCIYLSFI